MSNSKKNIVKSTNDYLIDFASYTTLHGLNRFSSSKGIFGKIVWLCVLLTCSGMSTWQIYKLIAQYQSGKVNTKLSIRHGTIQYPDVTFCNLNPIKYSSIKGAFFITGSQLNSDIEHIQTQHQLLNNHKAQMLMKNGYVDATYDEDFDALFKSKMEFRQSMYLAGGYFSDKGVVDAYGSTLNNILLACSYDGNPWNRSLIDELYDEVYGKCYRFTAHGLKNTHAGPLYGLQLILNINQSDYLPYVADEAGIRLAIQFPGSKAYLQNSGISLAPGFKTDISLRQKSLILLPRSSNCDFKGKFVSKQACLEDCLEKSIEDICNCTVPLKKMSKESKNYQCYANHEIECIWKVRKSNIDCGCKTPCRETIYEKTVTISQWPSKMYHSALKNLFESRGMNYELYRDSLLMVNIYFSDLSEELTEEEPAITIETLLSNIGGTLGLWIGMSVISLGELIELIILICHTTTKTKLMLSKDEEKPT